MRRRERPAAASVGDGGHRATKFAVVGLTQALAEEVAPHAIRANAVCPGIVSGTAMRAQVEALGRDLGLPSAVERVAGIPLGRLADPEDVASVVMTGGLWMHQR